MQTTIQDIVLCIIDSELGAGTSGASLGPSTVLDEIEEQRSVSKAKSLSATERLDKKVEIRKIRLDEVPQTLKTGGTTLLTSSSTHCKYIEAIANRCEKISNEVKRVSEAGCLPLILSGDHSSAAGVVGGLMRAAPEERLGVVWIDAHPDIHTPYTSRSGNVHGMTLAVVLGEDNIQEKYREPTEAELRAWQRMKALGSEPYATKSEQKHLLPEDVVLISTRSIDSAEEALIQRLNIHNISTKDLRKDIQKKSDSLSYEHAQIYQHALLPTLAKLQQCDRIYISFDIDSLDKSLVPGTGTPVEEGLSISEALALNTCFFSHLANSEQLICGWEMTEVNPKLDQGRKTIRTAASVLERVLKQINSV